MKIQNGMTQTELKADSSIEQIYYPAGYVTSGQGDYRVNHDVWKGNSNLSNNLSSNEAATRQLLKYIAPSETLISDAFSKSSNYDSKCIQ